MSEDREQERAEKREGAARPVTAAARRERRASARQVAPESGSDQTESAKADSAKVVSSTGRTTQSKREQGVETAARDRKVKRPNVFKRLARFLREVVAELRKVIWPTRKNLLTYTIVVLVFVAVMVALVFGLDYAFFQGVAFLFGK
ncbi:preprotein translocase subunit SecE [Kutzneria sp. 744]|uniref:preprotein translocase subunit SecE n=1 Tax=Kutzneria sp. (strain 744) TaxID=345341 RepID=UPI0003EED08D|nr:preprotein translocase subunit SecE [Kutzneria sp. 744]EWM15518.1 preprotein translocase SecE subunit [Kutzneria sp. 744]